MKPTQIDDKLKVIKKGDSVLDLGSAPGGWLQVALELVGSEGRVIGIDLQRIQPIEGVVILRGDVTKPAIQDKLVEYTKDGLFDAVLSDLAPEMSGSYSTDHARSIHLAEMTLDVSDRLLKRNGNVVTKVFQGDMIEDLLKTLRRKFYKVRRFSPEASRSRSAEVYIICKGFKGPKKKDPE